MKKIKKFNESYNIDKRKIDEFYKKLKETSRFK